MTEFVYGMLSVRNLDAKIKTKLDPIFGGKSVAHTRGLGQYKWCLVRGITRMSIIMTSRKR